MSPSFHTGSRQVVEGQPEEVGRREQNLGGALRWGLAAWESRLWGGSSCYMASFSLWEHLLSFISVSWMYRITLVSVGCRVLASFR